MTPNKIVEKEALQVYHAFWDSYTQGDLESFALTLDDDFEMIGTSETEICHSKAEGIAFFRAQMREVVGKAEMRNRKIDLLSRDPYILVNESCDIYVLTGIEWSFYSKLRLSTWLKETGSGWKVTQQHGSFPDIRVEEGETLAIDKINKENLELRDAIKRRTAELESKNRELQIEAALSRIRAEAVAMKTSADLLDIVVTMRKEFIKLGHEAHYFWHMMWLPDTYEKAMTSGDGTRIGFVMKLPRHIHGDIPLLAQWEKSKKPIVVYAMDVDAAIDYVDKMVRLGDFQNIDPQAPSNDDIRHIGGLTFVMARTTHGEIGFSLPGMVKNPPRTSLELLERFAGAFDLAHRRFLDLQKAEAQAREAQIEAALERVRSRSLAMHHSTELSLVVDTLLKEFTNLEIALTFCIINLIDPKDMSNTVWAANPETGKDSESYYMKFEDYPFHDAMWDAWKAQKKRFVYTLEGEEKKEYDEYLFSETEFRRFPKHVQEANKSLERYVAGFTFFKHSGLQTVSENTISDEDLEILERFGRVFEQAYTRFLDLQKAETQARESEIQLALERVRARTLAMQKSEELADASQVLDEQVRALGIETWGCAFHIYADNAEGDHEWFSSANGNLPFYKTPREKFFLTFYEKGLKGEKFYVKEFKGEECREHYEFLKTIPIAGDSLKALEESGIALPTYQIDHIAFFKYGYVLFITYEPVPESHDIFQRFAKVFEQTYTRFLDLEKAEALAREAQVELSLERIRAQVTSMQESSDLFDIVVSMRAEFLTLGHEADYFWHMRWLAESYEMSMTSEDGSRVGMVIRLPKAVHDEMPRLAAWEKGNAPIFILALNAVDAWDYIENMNIHGDYEIADPNAPTQEDIEHIGGLTFIIARTSHGEIGYSLPGMVPNPPKDALDTLVRFAGVFDLAYKRFEDLKAAEHQALLIREERDRLENTLNELRATQEQLVQQEKLASLGQLTAGIAHEIKNPLNFVNNFSEVSMELIEEALEEIQQIEQNEHATETAELLADVKTNLTKIHEHGTRANGIVSSMLQHARGGSGKMEPTDLNALIKEYVNLAFHGMRAGKNPFNVVIDLQLDPNVGKLLLINEDFSRVILNLCNNAFDAMREKLNTAPVGFEPRLQVKTAQQKEKIVLHISDNGLGIPYGLKDKILQPFFTTKKGTEGTGLGLSVTHDIIKAHGGTLRVEDAVEEGATFSIQLNKTIN
jgi:signal transduction histidine kinase